MFCPTCGTINQRNEERCLKCGASLRQEAPSIVQPLVSPQERINPRQPGTNERVVAGSRVARLGDRLLAIILDGILIMAVFAVLGSWVASRWGGMTEIGFSLTSTPALLAMGLTVSFAFLYYWILEGLLGATVGKLMLGIRVRDLSGGRCRFSQSFIRNILRIIDGIAAYLVGFLIAIFSKLHQRLGDHMAKTVVVEKTTGIFFRVFLVLIWLAAIGCSVWGAYVIHKGTPAITGPVVQKVAEAPLQAGAISTSGQLKMVDFQFTEGEKGPVRTAGVFKPKDRVSSQYHIIGYTPDNQGQISLEGQITITDPDNVPALNGDFTIKQKIAANDPVRGWVNFNVADYSPPGTYKIHIKIHDTIKNTDAELIAPFAVEAPPPVIAKRLELRDIQLSPSENGPLVSTPVIQAGGKIFMSAKLAGMQFKDNAVHVRIAFKLFDPRGELILNKPDFSEIKDSFDYCPSSFFLPLTANFSPPTGKNGVYTAQFLVTDVYGNNSRTFSAKFEVN